MENNLSKDLEAALQFLKYINEDSIVFDCCKMVDKGYMWDLRKHSHDVIEMIYMIDAKAHINTKDKTLYPTWSDIVVYPPHHVHQEYVDVNHTQKCIYIRFDVKSEKEFLEPFQLKDKEGRFYWLLEQIFKLTPHIGEPVQDKLILTYIKAILGNMELYLEDLSQQKQEVVDRAIQYIRHNYSEPITVDKLAAMFYVSPSYLSRVFQNRLQSSPMNFVNKMRIEMAKNLLGRGSQPINAIAQAVGIEDSKYFSRLFKKQVGVTPSEFRRNN